MRYALDTSVLVRILTGLPQPLAANVAMALEKKRRAGDSFVVPNLVLSEAYYAVQHHYGVDKAAALVALRELSLQRGFEFSDEAKRALALPNIAKASPGFVDRLIHGEQVARGVKVISCEKDFRKLPDTELLP